MEFSVQSFCHVFVAKTILHSHALGIYMFIRNSAGSCAKFIEVPQHSMVL